MTKNQRVEEKQESNEAALEMRKKVKSANKAADVLNNRILRYYKECNFVCREYDNNTPERNRDLAAIKKTFEKDIEKMIIPLSLEQIQALQKRHLSRPQKTNVFPGVPVDEAPPKKVNFSPEGSTLKTRKNNVRNSFNSYTPTTQPRSINKEEVSEILKAAIVKLECVEAAKAWIKQNDDLSLACDENDAKNLNLLDKIINNMLDMPVVEKDPPWIKILQNSDLRKAITNRIIQRQYRKTAADTHLLRKVVNDKPRMLATWLKTPARGLAAKINKLFEVEASSYRILKSHRLEELAESTKPANTSHKPP
ncbi:MAG: hypothetical protein K0S27_387 [Gammaproteobacteria bacterium]|jgi:hypothetical protein|nr:hypothetical protein [Gammaproteobacteria bacterium]